MHYLFWYPNEHINFRIPELEAIAKKYAINFKWIEKPIEDPYFILDLCHEDDACKLISRSILMRSCYELWGSGDTEEELHQNIKCKADLTRKFLIPENTFKINVTTYNKTIDLKEKLEKIESFSYLQFEGEVDLKNPKVLLHLIEFYGLSPNAVPDIPYKRFFGRWLSDGQRSFIHSFSLKSRYFIGSTSMDAQLAFIMTTMARVGPGSISVDPFVGTGSILVSAAQRGSFVWGWDIDYLTLHAKSKPTRHDQKLRESSESILSNLQQYGLGDKYLDILIMDSSNPLWRRAGLIDAIITDPPYGIREATEKIGTTKVRKYPRTESSSVDQTPSQTSYPAKMNYNIGDIYVDLLNFAASHLVIGGRLVCFVPIYREDYTSDVIPKHPCLNLESNCEQILNTHSSRRLITMVKHREPLSTEAADAGLLKKSEEFRIKFFNASQTLTKEDRQRIKMSQPTDKRGQGLSYRVQEVSISNNTDENVIKPT